MIIQGIFCSWDHLFFITLSFVICGFLVSPLILRMLKKKVNEEKERRFKDANVAAGQ